MDSKISNLTELAEAPASDDLLVVVDKSDTTQSASGTTKKMESQYISSATQISNATEKTTPVDADLFGLVDSAASFVLKKLSFLNLKLLITDWNNPVNTIREFYVDTNPATLLGVGTWSLLGAGRVTVCIDSSDTDFDTLGETRGAKTHTLTEEEMPSHNHEKVNMAQTAGGPGNTIATTGTGSANSSLQLTAKGGGQAHNNIQPSIVVYRWRRTA